MVLRLERTKLKDFNPGTGIRHYANREIILPKESRFYPSAISLRAHRKRFGF